MTDWHNVAAYLLVNPLMRLSSNELENRKRGKTVAMASGGDSDSVEIVDQEETVESSVGDQ